MTNLVVVFVDDMRFDVGAYVPALSRREWGWHEFTEARLNVPVCGPARAGLMTGQYALRAGNLCYDNSDTVTDENSDTWAPWISAVASPAAVETAFFGKYYRTISTTPLPSGWDHWRGFSASTQSAYGYSVFDGTSTATPGVYQTDYLATLLSSYLASATEPFFAWVNLTNPHVDTTGFVLEGHPDDIHKYRYIPDTLTLDLLDSTTDKPQWIVDYNTGSQISAGLQSTMLSNIRGQIQEAFAIDRFLRSLKASLVSEGMWDDTIIIFASDGGVMWGEQRMGTGGGMTSAPLSLKDVPYDPAAHVRLLARGPGFTPGTNPSPVCGQDITATAIDLWSATPTLTQDGTSLLDIAATPSSYTARELLYERGSTGTVGDVGPIPAAQGIITGFGHTYPSFKYVDYDDAPTNTLELYDLAGDPGEKTNLVDVPAYAATVSGLASALAALVA